MQVVPISAIIVPPNRQRRSIAPAQIEELAVSIQTKGLMHPPVVRPQLDGTHQLVAGERRLRAIEHMNKDGRLFNCHDMQIQLGTCPVTFIQDLSPIELKEAELEENILRVDLSWQERNDAVAELHRMREEQHGKQTITATAKELVQATGGALNTAQVEVSRALLVSKFMSDPKVSGARSQKEAYNIVSRKLEAEIQADLSAALKATTDHLLLCADAMQALTEATPDLYDVLLCDPPYGMGADSFGDAAPGHTYDDSWAHAGPLYQSILFHGYRICKAQAHLYLFCDPDSFDYLRTEAEEIGWKVFRTPIIWHKTDNKGHDPWPGKGFRRTYEMILYAIKGDKPCNSLIGDVIPLPGASDPLHPAKKPVELYERLLRRSCIPGDMVIDPCCGTGTIFAAANRLTLKATGVERDPTFAKVAEARMYEKD